MSRRASLNALHQLAERHGLLSRSRDQRGGERKSPTESTFALLQAMGAAIESVDDAEDALRARDATEWKRMSPPIVVAWNSAPPMIELRVPQGTRSELECTLTEESKTQRRSWNMRVDSLPIVRRAVVDGQAWEVRRLKISSELPMGYHALDLALGGSESRTMIFSAPMKCFGDDQRKELGIFAPWHALHGEREHQVGGVAELRAVGEWCARCCCSMLGTLPMLATFLDKPFEPSPYSPASRLFWNELIIETPANGNATTSRRRAGRLVDYRRAAADQRRALEGMARESFASGHPVQNHIEQFAGNHPDAELYARFRATMEKRKDIWQNWPRRLRDGDVLPEDYSESARRYHVFVQWTLKRQLSDLAARLNHASSGLYLDLPIGVHRSSFDTWRNQKLFALDASVGAPPDMMHARGQNWSFPPLLPEASREEGHRYFRQCIVNHLQFAKALRIDHVMGLHRLLWIPPGEDATRGIYVRYPAEELYAILSIESHRHRARIIGENLGTVPPEADRALVRHNILGMHVGIFEFQPGRNPPMKSPPRATLACLNTHDTPTFAGFWLGRDIDLQLKLRAISKPEAVRQHRERRRLRRLLGSWLARQTQAPGADDNDLERILRGALSVLCRSPARMVLINLEDLWLEEQPQNVPGTRREFPNWRRRLTRSTEQITSDSAITDLLRGLHQLR